jgi:hypothetical protein
MYHYCVPEGNQFATFVFSTLKWRLHNRHEANDAQEHVFTLIHTGNFNIVIFNPLFVHFNFYVKLMSKSVSNECK